VAGARDFIDEMRRRYPDASHHVYAFSVGYGASVTQGMSDDGEPSGTAGRPTLAVVQGAGLGDVIVVTIRYFGGAKLGTGGLVRAYTATAQAVLGAVPRTLRVALRRFQAHVTYDQYAHCRRALVDLGAAIEEEIFAERVTLRGTCPEEEADLLDSALSDATAGRVRLSFLD